MPVSFLSPVQRQRYGRYDGNPSAEQLARCFHLDDADRLAVANKRGERRWAHAEQIRTEHGYRTLTDPKTGFALARWLYARCSTGTDRPSALFDRATSWMLAHKVLLPGNCGCAVSRIWMPWPSG
jgi:hypothetical protein